jgi:hypothetical protein
MGGYCGDGEPVARFSEKVIRVRKAVKCDDCDTGIPVGGECVRTKYIYEGSWHSESTCLACEAVFKYLWDEGAECLYHGSLNDYIAETSPHDWLPGGEYESCPKCPIVDKHREKCAKEYEDA